MGWFGWIVIAVMFWSLGPVMAKLGLAHIQLRLGPASAVIPISATYPVVAMFISVLVLREQITAAKFAGVLLIIGGVYLVQRL